ncbi:polysaccharide lyase family 14 protein [Jaapia argillacea MUCL 33604]|uniref:Polysaccharide lyase family 14 protein n=1 Tax=Jaapia argillacea MUCL 33604 TaxID=933084 RepID=A0A067PYF8_9AGAM|nr:polysaccharide lyase family 14 protein [Jaapia argillacea MUCL 33604]
MISLSVSLFLGPGRFFAVARPVELLAGPILLSVASSYPPSSSITTALPSSHIITLTLTDVVTATPAVSPSTSTMPSVSTTTGVPDMKSHTQSNPSSTTTWAEPTHMTDLGSFKIDYFPAGQDNVKIVDLMPNQTPTAPSSSATPTPTPATSSNSSTSSQSILQVFYPAHSVNPGNSPQGGAEFYSKPLNLSAAESVTLAYSVFFPMAFDWVLAGKLPGLYGGHATCSGGDDALNCFSTRMMWRKDGMGELYLYAPRTKQTDSFCHTPPQSYCDSSYGMSIGRGSFVFLPGHWTTIKQTVTLNTPGKQDGVFILEVNGKLIMSHSDVYYRNAPQGGGGSSNSSPSRPEEPPASGSQGESSGGGLLGSLLGGLRRQLTVLTMGGRRPLPLGYTAQQVTESNQALVGFAGLFFSTFFGGHDPQYATPRDQYTWFKDFAMTINK